LVVAIGGGDLVASLIDRLVFRERRFWQGRTPRCPVGNTALELLPQSIWHILQSFDTSRQRSQCAVQSGPVFGQQEIEQGSQGRVKCKNGCGEKPAILRDNS
jgi:hypothetical protein